MNSSKPYDRDEDCCWHLNTEHFVNVITNITPLDPDFYL